METVNSTHKTDLNLFITHASSSYASSNHVPITSMASLKLGTKSEAFHREGQSWRCNSGLQSDVTIEIGEISFDLHKFPLLSRCGLLEKMIGESIFRDGSSCILQMNQIPGGAKAFELVAKFCYGVKIELNSMNIVGLRCAAEYLQMTEEYGEENMIKHTESFLDHIFRNWTDTIKALETCEEILPQAEELHIVSRCINSLAMKACSDQLLFNWPVSACNDAGRAPFWNGISTAAVVSKPLPVSENWWYEDVSFLSWPLYKRLIRAVVTGGMKPENIAGALIFYAKKYIPQMNRQASFKNLTSGSTISIPSEADQASLLEEIVDLLPNKKGVIHSRFLLRLLRTAMVLHTSQACRDDLEKRIGLQLDQASLEDLLIPNMGFSDETSYDIDCFQRILEHFMFVEQASSYVSPSIVEENQETDSLRSITMVANLVDSYLAEVAPDVNLGFTKFQTLAAAMPDYVRPLSDGMYRAIDIYLKAHQWLSDSEREQICRNMNIQKLSLDASTHAAQNERLPLRVIVQVLFFEQMRLRTSISGWFFVSENPDTAQNPIQNDEATPAEGGDMREEENMKEEFHKKTTKINWSLFCRRNSQHVNPKSSKNCNGRIKQPPCVTAGDLKPKANGVLGRDQNH